MHKPVLGAIASTPRGFTSLLMNISEKAVGKDRIIGQKFSLIDRYEKMIERTKDESQEHYDMRMYLLDGLPKFSKEARDHYVNMNPNGFYEHDWWSIHGIYYHPLVKKELEALEEIDPDKPKIIKLVCTGLVQTDPKYLKWVVYCMRHPFDVAKSQEALLKSCKIVLSDGRRVDLYEGVQGKVNSPRFYIDNIIQLANWRLMYPDIPMLFIDGDDLIGKPEETLKGISEFTGEDYMKGLKIIDNKLANRDNTDRDPENRKKKGIWEEAIYVHECLKKQDFQAIVDYGLDPATWFSKSNKQWMCPRIRGTVTLSQCEFCRYNDEYNATFIKNNIKFAETNEYDWRNEPCPFECGYDPDDENPYTIEESIENNHWLKHKPEFTPEI